MTPIATTNNNQMATDWRALRLFNLYRLTLSGLFLTLVITAQDFQLLGNAYPKLFRYAILAYLIASIIYSFVINQRLLPFHTQLNIHVASDIFFITIIMHASGGIASGLGTLLLISVGSGSLLTSRKIAVLYGSLATLTLLSEEAYRLLQTGSTNTYFTQTGILGATLMTAALAANFLVQRNVESEALARQRSLDLANLEQLNDYIIQHMQTGIVVVDIDSRVRLINESARRLLSAPTDSFSTPLADISLVLHDQLHVWNESIDAQPITFRSSKTSPEIQPKFARLGSQDTAGFLIFLEDTSAMAQQAQQLKLASLGRLTASIAHEIRNPLGAISHASQLLSESTHITPEDLRLTQIIGDHTQRVNGIIENVMRLSRRDRAEPVLFDLRKWLDDFRDDFFRSEDIDPADLAIDDEHGTVEVRMDLSQLHQVVWNLVRNGLRHSREHSGQPKVTLKIGQPITDKKPYLDIIDRGPGISPEQSLHIFEPFYTTESSGVGLGLYIARELCEGNQARLDYLKISEEKGGGSCFRITFADPRRKQQQIT